MKNNSGAEGLSSTLSRVSIIVPVFNVEKYLSRCIDSILSQSFTDFELLLIDDGSLDNSGRICDEYSKIDHRIRVFHKENGGVSSARNLGIENAVGDYLFFVDSDDYIDDCYLSDFMIHDEDLICQTAKIISEGGSVINTPARNELTEKNIGFDTGLFTQLLLDGVFNWTHSKRFRSSIVKDNGILFDTSINFAEDTLFVIQYSRFIRSIRVENTANYRYVVYRSRITLSNDYSEERIKVLRRANEMISSLVSTNETEKSRIYIKRMCGPYVMMVSEIENRRGFIFRAFRYLPLRKNEDFLKVLSSEMSAFPVPERVCNAIINRKPLSIIAEYYKWGAARLLRAFVSFFRTKR